jgi:hypothetical protein
MLSSSGCMKLEVRLFRLVFVGHVMFSWDVLWVQQVPQEYIHGFVS